MAALFSFGSGVTTIRGNLVQSSDQRAIMEAGTEPASDDLVVDAAGVAYVVVSIDKISPAGTPVAYDMHLRS